MDDQARRLSKRALGQYRDILDCFEQYLETYWPGHEPEYDRITGAGGVYCKSFGHNEIPDAYGEFLGYFMPCKITCGKDTLRTAGTVMKKLAKWLVETGYVAEAKEAMEQANEAVRVLPLSAEALQVLSTYLLDHPPHRYTNETEDHFKVACVEPGKIWVEPFSAVHTRLGLSRSPRKLRTALR